MNLNEYIYIYIYMAVDDNIYMYIYIYIYIYTYCHPQTDCVAKHARCFKLGSKPGWLCISRISYPRDIVILSVSEGIFHAYVFIYTLSATGMFNSWALHTTLIRIYPYIYIYIYTNYDHTQPYRFPRTHVHMHKYILHLYAHIFIYTCLHQQHIPYCI